MKGMNMPRVSDRRRKPRRRALSDAEAVWVKLEDLPGSPSEILAKIIDSSDIAVGVELAIALEENTYVLVNGHAGGPVSNGKMRARVVRCTRLPNGEYSAGLMYEDGADNGYDEYGGPNVDYYEVLQVNQKADPETIHRVFRLMAQRFHPDNAETGN